MITVDDKKKVVTYLIKNESELISINYDKMGDIISVQSSKIPIILEELKEMGLIKRNPEKFGDAIQLKERFYDFINDGDFNS